MSALLDALGKAVEAEREHRRAHPPVNPAPEVDECQACEGAGGLVTFHDGEGQTDECWVCLGTGTRSAT